MPVVILAGGFGTRLREQTEFIPKPMVPVGTRPILLHIMKIYAHYGYKRFIICLGYKGEIIKDYFLNYKVRNSDFTITLGNHEAIKIHNSFDEEDWDVTLSDTGLRAMTGTRIKRIEKFIDTDYFLLTYGDGVADIDLKKLMEFHRSHGKTATITGVRPPSRFGELIIEGNRVVEFGEKPQAGGSTINGGFFVFNRGVFKYLSEEENCTLEKEPLERLAKDAELMIYEHAGFWQCMDTLRDMNLLNEYWKSGNAPWKRREQ
ncbi:MAG TPA: glucose-1-phosphate cytidylyltransferase [Nitrospirae bacterium]|nr:glucose-1-phosphate cytidylyltransferase [Nitrospirota bacterium]HDK16417.1 glucose-1-phosphate cytidylyltransferase [Nitrospirota bacterium]HDK81799.1 glucose-1-phosphate cytidylyltransferase [Nitrospirota bacterium]HDO26215.1 glucose-1-phosphate cytidylyltransferase [Nitrospirota bacterium]